MRFIALGIFTLFGAPLLAAEFEVNSLASTGPGTLRAAIEAVNAAASANDQYDIVFRLPGDGVAIAVTPLPAIAKRYVRLIGQPVVGAGARPRLFAVSGTPILRFTAAGEEIELANLSLESGVAPEGGCVHAADLPVTASLTFDDVTFDDCLASAANRTVRGAAIYARGNVSVLDSRFFDTGFELSGSGRAEGGAIALRAGSLYVAGTHFAGTSVFGDSASVQCGGGAIWIQSGDLTAIDSTFSLTSAFCGAGGVGGAIGHSGRNLTLRNVIVRAGTAQYGGAVWFGPTEPPAAGRIENSVFIDNRTTRDNPIFGAPGGALFVRGEAGGPSMVMRNVTFARNGSATGGGAHVADSGAAWSTLHSIIFADARPDANGMPSDSCAASANTTYPLQSSFSFATDDGCTWFPGMQQVTSQALALAYVGPAQSATVDVRLQPGSIAIDGGSPATPAQADAWSCLPADIDLKMRPSDGDGDGAARCDAGARESLANALFAHSFEG
jgi:hypothetical protein